MMRICASLGSVDVTADDTASADMIEIRTDIFDAVPKNILKKGQTGIVTFKNGINRAIIPDGWIADVGYEERPDVDNDVITSYHDFSGTPDADAVISIMNGMNGDIVKGAFTVNNVKDTVTLIDAACRIKKRHVILGMGELGKITRIRQERMNNEFTFAYAGKATAPGQLSIAEMRGLGDDCVITGIIGSDIGYTRSPKMHDAAFGHADINGRYLVFDTPLLDRIGEFITKFDIKGVNVTKPYKTDIIGHIDMCDKISDEVGAVNTVVNDNGKLKGYNTDVHGIDMALRMNSVDVKGQRALILGSGGAARSCAYFLSGNGCDATVTGRNIDAAKKIAKDLSVKFTERTSVAVKAYDIIINCIPLNKDRNISEYPVKIEQTDHEQVVFDMVYGRTHLTDIAEARECIIVRGEDMLAHQGARSFELFTSKSVSFRVMRDAV
ncbi:MAG: type I 3-dehydroquinate dehydratase [Methanomassiliicoccaceae archaeon]|jgi:3-dehydroquinate dehydratase/shikimate dehydrogenase|nr:type I 3-dehydroquinate dehydratase [Methanomassiliicoccaceae archaeon]